MKTFKHLFIFGRSGSGKDTYGTWLEKRGFGKIPQYTSRKPREGEIDGKDYIFMLNEDIERLADVLPSIVSFYKSNEGKVYYATSELSIFSLANTYTIVNLKEMAMIIRYIRRIAAEDINNFTSYNIWGTDFLLNEARHNVIPVFIDTPRDICYERLIERGTDDVKELLRRQYHEDGTYDMMEVLNLGPYICKINGKDKNGYRVPKTILRS